VAHEQIFLDDDDRRHFLGLLASTVNRFDWRCLAFCLMATHYHLVLETTRARLSGGIQRLNGRHAQSFNARHGRRGHLFGARFASWVITSEQHLQETCRYVLLNPVRAGLCRSPEEWRWSASPPGQFVLIETYTGASNMPNQREMSSSIGSSRSSLALSSSSSALSRC
jgi:putative transposase